MRTVFFLIVLCSAFSSDVARAAETVLTTRSAAAAEVPKTVDADRNAAGVILKARQDAVDLIRAGKPAPYYLVSPSLPDAKPTK